MGVHISGIVAGVACLPAAMAWFGRGSLPLSVDLALWHIAATGFVVAAASSEHLAKHTTGLLGKVSTLASAGAASCATRGAVPALLH